MDAQSPRPITTVRRNPPRRAKQTPSTKAPDPSTSSSAAVAATGITPFPLDELLQIETHPPRKTSSDGSENLKVFLRVRPLEIRPKPAKNPKPKPKPRGKQAQAPSPNGTAKAKSNKACLVVNDSSSVTLSALPSVFDGKRSKSELYDGFSFVFPPESAQEEIYERVMNPLLIDFMGGKSSLLAAMGPTGSGKTHTMFGSPREPGMVPLALRHIFSHAMENANDHLSRSYYLSMFEIYSERGKGERIFDLSLDGGDLFFQQSSIKGLQEIRISDATQAEGLVARGLLKRATAATSANDQSSRSQCIINIRCVLEDVSDENKSSAHDAVLTIADLAGAEKERKTGNQGARLLESNFINNTSMVFGLCLRSLLEHQKYPKRSFEKHFKNSLLTRYLRDFLEGKKRMTLILNVKPGEGDYQDTSFLLRQASPCMKIKFNIVEDAPSAPHQKRNTISSSRPDAPKRRKFGSDDAGASDPIPNDSDAVAGCQILEKEAYPEKFQEAAVEDISSEVPSSPLNILCTDATADKELQVEVARMRRNEEVMRKISKALWNTLKQYKKKLEESENEVKYLKETLGNNIDQVEELKKELSEVRSRCSCYKHSSSKETSTAEEDAQSGQLESAQKLICRSPEISSTTKNESEVLGLKGILFDANTAGEHKSAFRSPMERRSFVVERQKTAESLHEVEHLLGHLESPSNFSASIPSGLYLTETINDVSNSARLDCTKDSCSPVEKETVVNENKLESLCDTDDSNTIVEDFSDPRHENRRPGCTSSLEHDYISENLGDKDSLGVMGKSCCKSSTEGIEHSGILIVSAEVEDSTSILSSSDECSTLLLEKAETSDTSCSILSTEDTENQSNEDIHEEGTLCGLKHEAEYTEGIKKGQAVESLNASLTGLPSSSHDAEEDENDKLYKSEFNIAAIKADLDVSLIEDVKENECCQVREHLGNGKHASSAKASEAEKPKRRLLPASTLLLKDFNRLDVDMETAKEGRTKVTAVGKGRSQGSISLVRFLTGKQ